MATRNREPSAARALGTNGAVGWEPLIPLPPGGSARPARVREPPSQRARVTLSPRKPNAAVTVMAATSGKPLPQRSKHSYIALANQQIATELIGGWYKLVGVRAALHILPSHRQALNAAYILAKALFSLVWRILSQRQALSSAYIIAKALFSSAWRNQHSLIGSSSAAARSGSSLEVMDLRRLLCPNDQPHQ